MPTRTRSGGSSTLGHPGHEAEGEAAEHEQDRVRHPHLRHEHEQRGAGDEQDEKGGEVLVAEVAQERPLSRSSFRADSDFSSSRPIPRRISGVFVNWMSPVGDDLHVVAPRVAERVAAEDLDAGLTGRGEHRLAVVDDEAEMPLAIGLALRALGEREELVAHVDEGHPGDAAPQLELEQPAVEGERLVDRADLEREMIDPDRTSHGTDITHRV